MITTTITPPEILLKYNVNLLRFLRNDFSGRKLLRLYLFIQRKIYKFKKYRNTIKELDKKIYAFLELHERIEAKERENKEKGLINVEIFGYIPNLSDKRKRRVFELLEQREKISSQHRKNRTL